MVVGVLQLYFIETATKLE